MAALRSIPEASVDAIITDPPYSSGGLHVAERRQAPSQKYVSNGTKIVRPEFSGDNRDQISFMSWCALWLAECHRIARVGAPICIFCDWRQLAVTTTVLQMGGFVLRGVCPWDKTESCRKAMGRFAAQSEFIVWGSHGAMGQERGVGCLPGVFRVPVVPREKYHITGKPTELMLKLVEICSPNSLVLDPFCGSGSTGVAALRRGHRFLGIEREAVYAQISRERLEAEALGQSRAARRTGQLAIFSKETA